MTDTATLSRVDPLAWRRAAAAGLGFRRATDADMPFLHCVYASTRADELALVDWTEPQKAAFVEMQFRAQHAHCCQHHPAMDRLIITVAGEPAGRLYLERNPREHAVVDIALLAEHRGRGHGGALLRDLMDAAAAAGRPVTIHVEKFNPAMRLYQRLGFAKVSDAGLYDLMRWNGAAAP